MNISALTSASAAGLDSVPLERLANDPSLSEAEKVKEASRQFEAIILRQILAQARKTVFHSKLNEESTSSGIYQDMVTGQLADAISRSGSFGLARSLEIHLEHSPVTPSPNRP